MIDDTYVINLIAKDGETVTVQDIGLGADWLVLFGSYEEPSDIRLGYLIDNGATFASAGLYYVRNDAGVLVGSRAILNAPADNARGSTSEDFIQGNELDNIIYGDFAEDGMGGNDTLWGFDGNDFIYGGAGNDEITGDGGSDFLFGNAGRDSIYGGSGVDFVEGGAGGDVMSGGGDLQDRLSYSTSPAGVTINITFGDATIGIGGDALGDTITGFSYVVGSDHDDIIRDTVTGTITFGYNKSVFQGLDGDDRLFLGGGNDTGYGGLGTDDIEGGEGKDSLVGNGDDDLLYGGVSDDTLNGGSGNDYLDGGDGRDSLDGGTGNDTLFGAASADTLTGGTGADVFSFRAPGDSRGTDRTLDRITDFARGDVINLRALDANSATASNDNFVFVGRLPFSGAAGEVRLADHADGTLVLLNLDTDRTPEMSILLTDVFLVREEAFVL